jgi:CTP:molybdopterin cytidylyltransferase MocA
MDPPSEFGLSHSWFNGRSMKIAGVVVAAGRGSRMGGPKALLPWHGRTLLSAVCDAIARPRVSLVLAVVGHDADRVAADANLPATVRVVVNDRYEEGMLSSIRAGIDAAEAAGAEAALVHPVDHPIVDPATVDRVIDALEAGAIIAVPSHAGRRGHPAGFARPAWPALRAAPPATGARAVLALHPEWVRHVDGDPGCLMGMNTPEDYHRLSSMLNSG